MTALERVQVFQGGDVLVTRLRTVVLEANAWLRYYYMLMVSLR